MLLVILYTTLLLFCHSFRGTSDIQELYLYGMLLKIKIENVRSSSLLYFHLTGVSLNESVTGENQTSFQSKSKNFGDISK